MISVGHLAEVPNGTFPDPFARVDSIQGAIAPRDYGGKRMTAASEESVAVVEGSKGSAEIFEIWAGGRLIEYRVRFEGGVEIYENIGEAYIAAGEKAGRQT